MPTRAEKIQNKLRDIVDDLRRMADRGHPDQRDIMELKEMIHNIDEEYQDACIHERDGSIEPGQAIIAELLEEAHELSSDLLEEAESEDD
ncbi:hypothetical protein HDU97_008131 [Phlyctochytrium planicorne]|nr:hypothetical protein HDU97_008131 [Phlyctochytrium planicorne]